MTLNIVHEFPSNLVGITANTLIRTQSSLHHLIIHYLKQILDYVIIAYLHHKAFKRALCIASRTRDLQEIQVWS